MERKNRRTDHGYICRKCGEKCQTLNQLSVHGRTKHKPPRKLIPQLIPTKYDMVRTTQQLSRIRQLDKKLRVSLTWCLPHNWEWVRLWKVSQDDMGIIMRIEPLQLKKIKPSSREKQTESI